MIETYFGFDGQGGVRSWNDIFNTSRDPCLWRLTGNLCVATVSFSLLENGFHVPLCLAFSGLWCEFGHVVMVIIENNNVFGELTPYWSLLGALRYFDAGFNFIYGMFSSLIELQHSMAPCRRDPVRVWFFIESSVFEFGIANGEYSRTWHYGSFPMPYWLNSVANS